MTLEEAIDLSKAAADDMALQDMPHFAEAVRIGIEALKQKQRMLEWFKYSKSIFGQVGKLGECATIIAHIPIKEWETLGETKE